jgi:raffinose synthase
MLSRWGVSEAVRTVSCVQGGGAGFPEENLPVPYLRVRLSAAWVFALGLAAACCLARTAVAHVSPISVQYSRPTFEAARGWLLTDRSATARPLAPAFAVERRALGDGIDLFAVRPGKAELPADAVIALCLPAWPQFAQGVQLWRYEPWRAWSKPIKVARLGDLETDEIQVFYWRDRDGRYGVAIPVSGSGLRTTLGSYEGGLAAKAYAGVALTTPALLPLLLVSYDANPYAAFHKGYRAALKVMGRSKDAVENKHFPPALAYLGWNTWNASHLGESLDAALILNMAREVRDGHLPIGTLTIDDGYFAPGRRLQSFAPDLRKFPHGFAALNHELKTDYGLKSMGVWITLDGYWGGIEPGSEAAPRAVADLFAWTERIDQADVRSAMQTGYFIKPDSAAFEQFYWAYIAHRKADGFDFLKVDNQLVVERMAKGNYPVFALASAMHRQLNAAADRYFGNAVINCMDMTADAYLNFAGTPVARAVEDYFPFEPNESYQLGKGNAAAHVLQAMYNALYFGQFSYPDFDMFETTNPHARLHAVVRAANNGPIYITDRLQAHDAGLLRSLTLSDGRTLRADTPLIPTPDSLFQVQDRQLFKASSRVGGGRLLLLANLADADNVQGEFGPSDLSEPPGPFAAYETETGALRIWHAAEREAVTLGRFESRLWNVQSVHGGMAAFGRKDKFNGAAALTAVSWGRAAGGLRMMRFGLLEAGPAGAYAQTPPTEVTVDGKKAPFTYRDGLVTIDGPVEAHPSQIVIYRKTDDRRRHAGV